MANSPQSDMVSLLKAMAGALVDNPEQIVISAIKEGNKTILQLEVAASDVGKVIGK